ncbi:MAG: hypothetical protein ACRCX2_10020 [Paraclostridium sp.]
MSEENLNQLDLSFREKKFADALLKGNSIEKAYISAYGEKKSTGQKFTARELQNRAEKMWKNPIIQRYVLKIETEERKRKTEVLTKEYFASDIFSTYEKLLQKSKEVLSKEKTTLSDKDILKFVLDYSNQVVNLLNLNQDKNEDNEESQLSRLFDMLDEQSKTWEVENDIVDVTYQEVYEEDEKAYNVEAENMLKKVEVKGF